MLFAQVPLIFLQKLPKFGPYSETEAMFFFDVDRRINGIERSMLEYSKIWGWDRGKVTRFIKFIKNISECNELSFSIKPTPQKENTDSAKNAHINQFKNNSLQTQSSNESALTKHKTDTLLIERERENMFAQFWEAYPKKKSKPAALKSWMKLKPTPECFSEIMSALDLQKQHNDWIKSGGQFIPYPNNWINNKSWEDKQPTTIVPATSATTHRSRLEEMKEQGLL